jgi:hypothetical protein
MFDSAASRAVGSAVVAGARGWKGRRRPGHGPGRLWPWPGRPGVRGEVKGSGESHRKDARVPSRRRRGSARRGQPHVLGRPVGYQGHGFGLRPASDRPDARGPSRRPMGRHASSPIHAPPARIPRHPPGRWAENRTYREVFGPSTSTCAREGDERVEPLDFPAEASRPGRLDGGRSGPGPSHPLGRAERPRTAQFAAPKKPRPDLLG